MEALSTHAGVTTVHQEDNTICISGVEAKIVTNIVKHAGIPVCFQQENFDNGFFVPKYDNSSVIPEDMCTKPCSGLIIIWSNKWMTGLRLYLTSNIEHYQLMILHEFVFN